MTNLLIFLEYIQPANLEHLDDFLRYLTFQLRYIYIYDIYCRIMGDYLAAICFHTISIITYEKQILEQSNVSPLCQFCKADVSSMCWLNIRWAGVQGPGLLDV